MQKSFENKMAAKSEAELDSVLSNTSIYTPEAIYAALDELKSRGRQFSAEELNDIEVKIKAKHEAEKEDSILESGKGWQKNVVTDEAAPAFYSHRAIWAFSTVFTVIFGAVLLASNVRENKKAKWTIIGFGIIYTASAIFLLNMLKQNSGLTLMVNAIGGWLLTTFFWNKYVGSDLQYRAKPIWKPLIISIIITIPFILAIFLAPAE